MPCRDIDFVGGERGNEATLVGEAGFSIDLLPGRGIQRKLTTENLGSVLGLLKGMAKGLAIVSKRKPDVVVPRRLRCVRRGRRRRAPTHPDRGDRAERQGQRRASPVRALGEGVRPAVSDTDLPNGGHRQPIERPSSNPWSTTTRPRPASALSSGASQATDPSVLDGRVVLAVWAGSLGATRINKVVRDWRTVGRSKRPAINHIIGRRDWDDFRQDHRRPGTTASSIPRGIRRPHGRCVDRGRPRASAGPASTVSEIRRGRAAVDSRPVTDRHRDDQRANAAELVAAGAARLVHTPHHRRSPGAGVGADPHRRRAATPDGRGRPNGGPPAAAADVAQLVLDTGGLR